MKRKKLKEIGADSFAKLIDRANEKQIGKDQIVQFVLIGNTYHLVYVER